MQDAVSAEPEDEVPEEFRVPEPEPVIAACSVTKWNLLTSNLPLPIVLVYGPTRVVIDLFGDHPLRAAVWAVLLCCYAQWLYQFGWRRPYRVEFTQTTLRWKAPFRQVEVPLLSVREVYVSFWRNQGRKLVVDGTGMRMRKLSLHALPDMDPFFAVLTTAAPGIKVHVSPMSVRRRF